MVKESSPRECAESMLEIFRSRNVAVYEILMSSDVVKPDETASNLQQRDNAHKIPSRILGREMKYPSHADNVTKTSRSIWNNL
jgi:hypothetical protein